MDAAGAIWVVHTGPAEGGSHVWLTSTRDRGRSWRPPIRVTSEPERVAADGENRPKLAFGPRGELYVTWTRMTSAHFTGDVRFARSTDEGVTWSEPVTVHRDPQLVSHRFESPVVDGDGNLWIAWLDRRDRDAADERKEPYTGAAIYYTFSTDGGATWQPERKLADSSCECCRIATALDVNGKPLLFWRHVFPPNERDHALATLDAKAVATPIRRATFDRWRVDACPHHGPGLAVDARGRRHAVWFNVKDGVGRAYYGQLTSAAPAAVRELPEGAMHADVIVAGDRVAVAWHRFHGGAPRIESWISLDGGRTFSTGPTLAAEGRTDQPRLVRLYDRPYVVWRTAERIQVREITPGPTSAPAGLR